jgi:HEAT repeat protein
MSERPHSRPPIRVFLSSPGDVADERALARRLLKDELPYDPLLRGQVLFEVVSWDDPVGKMPMPADLAPQEAVNRFGPKPSECDIVVVVLWSRLGTRLDENDQRKPDGEPYLSGTEWEFENAFNARPQPEILVYRRMEEPKVGMKDPDWAEKRRQYDLVEQFFQRFKNPDGSLRGGVTPYDTPTDFQKCLSDNLKFILRERLGRTEAGAVADVPVWHGSPYPGLRAFTDEEAPIYFGRSRDVDALIARLRDGGQRFLSVVGPSGAGKSSLVQAGLLPRLKDGALEGSQRWPILTFTPGAAGKDPFLALASSLRGMLPAAKRRPQIEIAKTIAEMPERLTEEYAATLLANQPSDAALVFFVDQLEELFTLVAEDYRHRFVELLGRAATHSRLRVLATLRADFVPQAMIDPTLAPLLQMGTILIGVPGPTALADMIRKPAERAGLYLEDGLVDEILKDADPNPGEALPLVAFCLKELHQRTASGQHLTLNTYRALGGLRGTIGQRASELLEDVKNAAGMDLDSSLSEMFRYLVHVDATGKETRQRAPQRLLMAAPSPIPQLLDTLINGRLLLAEELGGQATVTLAHEALLQEWPALQEWLERNRPNMQSLQRHLLGLTAPDADDRRHAAQGLGRIGPAAAGAVPELAVALGDADAGVRRAAAETLGGIGPAAAEAVRVLAAALGANDGDFRRVAARALGRIGPAAVPALIAVRRDAELGVRDAVAETLREIGSAAVPILKDTLGDADAYVREAAAEILGGIGPAAAEAVPTLAVALGDVDAYVRSMAAGALGGIGPAAAEAMPALAAALNDAKTDVRLAAASALGRIGPAAVPALAAALNDANTEDDANTDVRIAAASALGRIGPVAVPALAAALGAAGPDVRRAAIYALRTIGPPAVPALTAALGDDNPDVRRAAAGGIGPPVIPELAVALGDADAGVRRAAAETLGGIGPAAAEAVRVLAAALGDADAGVRRAATGALWGIGPAAAGAVPALAAALGDTEPDVRRAAIDALRTIGPPAVPALTTALSDVDADVRRAAAYTLGGIGPAAAEAVPALAAAALGDPVPGVRRAAAETLRGLGSAAAEAVPALASGLSGASPRVRYAAAETLGGLGPAAVPALIAALGDTNPDVRHAADGALWRIAHIKGPEQLCTPD